MMSLLIPTSLITCVFYFIDRLPTCLVLCQIVMENRSFIEFVDEIYGRDELPVWRNVAQVVAAMAAFQNLHTLKVRLSSKTLIFI